MESKNIPFPEKIINYYDIAKGVGEVVFHTVFDQFRHSTPSEHFTKEATDNETPRNPS